MSWLTESLEPIWEKYKIEAILISLATLITLASLFLAMVSNNPQTEPVVPRLTKVKAVSAGANKIIVDLAGSIERSDTYEVSAGARLKDVLILAGGLSQNADRQFFSRNFNLARILQDQEKIYIPSTEEIQSQDLSLAQSFTQTASINILGASEKVNINTASLEQLDTLAGIGPVTAQKIIKNRPYQSIVDLLDKKSVGKSVFEKIKDMITL